MKKKYYNEYIEDQTQKALIYGRLGAKMALVVLPVYYLKDVFLTEYPFSTFVDRMLPFTLSLIFIRITQNGYKKNGKSIRIAYSILAMSFMVMVCGIVYKNYSQYRYNGILFTAVILLMLSIYIFSYSIKNYLLLIIGIPYFTMTFMLFKNTEISKFFASEFFNPTLIYLIIGVLAYIDEKRNYSEFCYKKELETKEEALKEEIRENQRLQKKIEKDALVDELTNVFNRKACERILKHEVMQMQREKSAFSILYLDLNNLKLTNDKLGHKAGDDLLKKFSLILQHEIRESDYIFRMGGDEFLILEKGVSQNGNIVLIERIKRKCEGNNIGVAIGCVNSEEIETDNIDEIIKEADRRMYLDKKGSETELKYVINKDINW